MFLEPVSQIVTKEVVGAVEMNLSIEKLRSIKELNPIRLRNRVSGNDPRGE
ncbi:MAG: hypothetical protein ABI614_27245 [Planctomycetota bacterium]